MRGLVEILAEQAGCQAGSIPPVPEPLAVIISLDLAMLLTAVIETPMILCLTKDLRIRHKWLICVLVNFATNLVINLLLCFIKDGGLALTLALEAAVVISEGFAYRLLLRLPLKRALPYSLLANLTSFLTGILLFGLSI